jgi:hypothetical protein
VTEYRATRCKTCRTVSKGYAETTLSPSVVLAYCLSCRKKTPAEDLGAVEVETRPTRVVVTNARDTPEEVRASGWSPAEPDLVETPNEYGLEDPVRLYEESKETEDRIQAAYRDWRGTPDGLAVVAAVRRRALELRRRGWRRYGIQALAEVVRFDQAVAAGPDQEGYKVNNSHLSRLARDLMVEDDELRGFFEIRELRSREGERS